MKGKLPKTCDCGSTCCETKTGCKAQDHSLEEIAIFTYLIQEMDCPTEEALIRKKLEDMPGVKGLEFNLLRRELKVRQSLDSQGQVEAAIISLGMKVKCLNGESVSLYVIQGMDCPSEEALIRKKLALVDGVFRLEFNLLQRTLKVEHSLEARSAITAALETLDLGAQLMNATDAVGSEEDIIPPTPWLKLALAGSLALASELLDFACEGGGLPPVCRWGAPILAVAAILLGGLGTYKKGWIALKNLNLNMNALMTIAVTGALCIGQWPEAAMVMVLFALAEVIEARSLDRARDAIRGLMALTPEIATVQQSDGTWAEIEVKTVAPGSLVRVRPGERIALDGEVVEGRSTVNQAPITGESLPVDKTRGDVVYAGSVNSSGSFVYRVTAAASESTLARVIRTVEEAQGNRASTQRFVDQFARWYTPAVFLLALLVAVLPPLLYSEPWQEWLYRGLVLLVIACPCALVISTPVSIVSALAASARKGILVKGGVYLELGRNLRWLALDKTGTLTCGTPVQTDFLPWNGADVAHVRALAASLAARSDHPVSRAIATAAEKEGTRLLDVADFEAMPGKGVQGRINDTPVLLANHRRVHELGLCSPALEDRLAAMEAEGKSVVLLADNRQVLAVLAVADTVRETSREALAELHSLGVNSLMLSGDNTRTVAAISSQVGADRALGELLPEDKLREIEKLMAEGYKVGMVGDGINDAPALARADIGFAMGAAGTDTAMETADVALMDDDLRKIPAFIQLSRATVATLRQNILLALGIKAVFMGLAFLGQATMWMAVFADMGTSLLVVFNGLRLLRK